jgi:hypothetical protein
MTSNKRLVNLVPSNGRPPPPSPRPFLFFFGIQIFNPFYFMFPNRMLLIAVVRTKGPDHHQKVRVNKIDIDVESDEGIQVGEDSGCINTI